MSEETLDTATTSEQELALLKKAFPHLEWEEISQFDWMGKHPGIPDYCIIFTYWQHKPQCQWAGALYTEWEEDNPKPDFETYAMQGNHHEDLQVAIAEFKAKALKLCTLLLI